MSPPTDCIAPIGEELLGKALRAEVEAEYYATVTRKPTVYRGNPFLIEVGLAYGGELSADDAATVYRYANRVPLQYQQGACAVSKAVTATDWRSYQMQQPRGALPVGPLLIMVHIASVWVPFTSESKEAIAHYPEIIKEIRLGLQECGRQVAIHIRRKKREADEEQHAQVSGSPAGRRVDGHGHGRPGGGGAGDSSQTQPAPRLDASTPAAAQRPAAKPAKRASRRRFFLFSCSPSCSRLGAQPDADVFEPMETAPTGRSQAV